MFLWHSQHISVANNLTVLLMNVLNEFERNWRRNTRQHWTAEFQLRHNQWTQASNTHVGFMRINRFCPIVCAMCFLHIFIAPFVVFIEIRTRITNAMAIHCRQEAQIYLSIWGANMFSASLKLNWKWARACVCVYNVLELPISVSLFQSIENCLYSKYVQIVHCTVTVVCCGALKMRT